MLQSDACIDVSRENLVLLLSIASKAAARLKEKSLSSADASRFAHVLLAALRVLRANLRRLNVSGVDPYSLGVEVRAKPQLLMHSRMPHACMLILT